MYCTYLMTDSHGIICIFQQSLLTCIKRYMDQSHGVPPDVHTYIRHKKLNNKAMKTEDAVTPWTSRDPKYPKKG